MTRVFMVICLIGICAPAFADDFPAAATQEDMQNLSARVKEQHDTAVAKKSVDNVCIPKTLGRAIIANLGSQPWRNVDQMLQGLRQVWPVDE